MNIPLRHHERNFLFIVTLNLNGVLQESADYGNVNTTTNLEFVYVAKETSCR